MPKKHNLEPTQATAAYTLDRHVSVVAGPGAGKTTVLVERYLHILREKKPSSIDQIVAITFTNRAANEMRERLRNQLDSLLSSATVAERHRWMRYKRTLDGAVITTIHGFCMRLLREFPVEAELDPQFVLLDEHRAATLLAAAVEESLSEFLSRHDDSVSRLTAGVGRSILANALYEIYLRVRDQGLSLDQILIGTTASHSGVADYQKLCDEVDVAMGELISTAGLSGKAETKRVDAQRSWSQVRAVLRDNNVSLAEYCGAIVEFRESARPSKLGKVGSVVARLDELLWGRSKEKAYGRLPQMMFDIKAGNYATSLLELLKLIDNRFNAKKLELSALDFDDLQVRTIKLLKRPEVLGRAAQRYKYFLVDEFQDTNGLQRELLETLVLNSGGRANLFIVGDRKQSIYGFRGADVDVFGRMTQTLIEGGGELVPLPVNFRSQPPLIAFFNYLFARFFRPTAEVDHTELSELGYVEHEASESRRQPRDAPPLVELLLDTLAGDDDPKIRKTPRERDANQLVQRIISLTSDESGFAYQDIALLFRAMSDVAYYEAEFRRAGIPFQTVLGKGFYEREEITDLIQLCRFLDNRTDEIALAAVLRSPLCGISDNALLALRLAPFAGETQLNAPPEPRKRPRQLFSALLNQHEIDFIHPAEREALQATVELLNSLIERRNRYPISDLLRYAVEKSRYSTVIAATHDGAQRLANVRKLFNLAERFERSGAHLIRDFVKYVQDFETIGSRESEGQLDDSANAIKLMTIHQAKGLEFPVVIIPDLHRSKPPWEGYFLLDRHRGLTLKIPNGRGQMVSGRTFATFSERAKLRDAFESMRLLYVAATRAKDRLILSGVTRDSSKLLTGDENWLQLIWQALELGPRWRSELVELDEATQLQLTFNLGEERQVADHEEDELPAPKNIGDESLRETFPLLRQLKSDPARAIHRFSVTQLINYQRCPRQYYFDRVLRLPSADELSVWNNAEAPEPPANLTAALKGAVIHRFCERYSLGQSREECLRSSFEDVVKVRQAELADRLGDINMEAAIKDLFPLAENYLQSDVFRRVEHTRKESSATKGSPQPSAEAGLWSELSFRLRRPLGVLSGTIDKLLISRSDDDTLQVEIIDFKTNRFPKKSDSTLGMQSGRLSSAATGNRVSVGNDATTSSKSPQLGFDFETAAQSAALGLDNSLDDALRIAANDYQLQMQAYALALRQLIPSLSTSRILVTLHFVEPNVEYHLSDDLLETTVCEQAIDAAMLQITSATEPADFPVRPAIHCRMCNFLNVCSAGREWLRKHQRLGF